MRLELKEMLKPVSLGLDCYNFRGSALGDWPASTWQALPFSRPPNVSWAFSEKLILNVQAWRLRNICFFLSCSDHEGGSENRKQQSRPHAALAPALTLSAPLRAEWYQRRRLNGSSDEFPGFVRWRKFTGHTICLRVSHFVEDSTWVPPLIPLLMRLCHDLCWFFFFFEKARHYCSSTRYKSRSSSVKSVQDRMQRLIFCRRDLIQKYHSGSHGGWFRYQRLSLH